MRRLVLAVALMAGCGADGDDHFPQASQLVGIDGTSVTCRKTIEPAAESFTDTTGVCEWECVYSGTVLYARLRVDLERADVAAAWRIAESTWTDVGPGDCVGMAR
jgi:hypothetical protein